ncbi:hypothetical protein V1509DRAFT_656014 [Lipomyces kononenkoae]
MYSPMAKFQRFYGQPRTSRSDQILLLTDCTEELYQTIISEIKETYPQIEVVYSASQQTLYVSTICCEIGETVSKYVADTLGGLLNYRVIDFDSHLLFAYMTMPSPFVVKSCVVPPNDLMILRYSEDREVSTTVHAGRVFFEWGYLRHYKQLMTKIKLHASTDKSNLPVTIFLTLVDESPKFEIPEIDFAEELNYAAQMQDFTDTILNYRFRYSYRGIIRNIEYYGQQWFGELTSCLIHVYRYYPELKTLALLRCIDCLEWLKTCEGKVKLDVDLHLNDALLSDMIPHPRRSFGNPWIPLSLEQCLLVENINIAISTTAISRFEKLLKHHTGEGEE